MEASKPKLPALEANLPIILVPHRPEWEQLFNHEAARIADCFGNNLLKIEWIGSTAIPGICAKPIIDMIPVVEAMNAVDAITAKMEALGYHAMGAFGMPRRRYFIRIVNKDEGYHVHTFEKNNPEVTRHILFRDYMRAHPDEAKAYGALKEKLGEAFRDDRMAYCHGKTAFIESIDKKALAWATS
tara:strand:- start:3167 stop:3721 length:555 start_codon:yes stop_codon:yes gene_type:complete